MRVYELIGQLAAIADEHGNQEIEIATQNGTSITREYNLKDIQFDPGYPPDDFEDGDTGTSSAIEIILSRAMILNVLFLIAESINR